MINVQLRSQGFERVCLKDGGFFAVIFDSQKRSDSRIVNLVGDVAGLFEDLFAVTGIGVVAKISPFVDEAQAKLVHHDAQRVGVLLVDVTGFCEVPDPGHIGIRSDGVTAVPLAVALPADLQGHAQECLTLASGRRVRVSVVDAANVLVFARASDLNLTGSELATDLTNHPTAMQELEEIRGIIAEKLGIVGDRRDASKLSPGIPKIGFVAPSADYTTSSGEHLRAEDMQFQARVLSMQSPHRAYMVAGAIATAVASRIPGTVVYEVCQQHEEGNENTTVRFGHPAGLIDVRLKLRPEGEPFTVESGTVGRTARVLMSGLVYL